MVGGCRNHEPQDHCHFPLQDNQNWLFSIVYDRAAFELSTHRVRVPQPVGEPSPSTIPVFLGYSGEATQTLDAATAVVRTVVRAGDARFGVGPRTNRKVSIELGDTNPGSQPFSTVQRGSISAESIPIDPT